MDDLNAGLGPEAQYRAFLREGRFMLQRSHSTGRYVFYPRVAAPGTGETDLDWVEASGDATVYAITVNRAREGAYNLALVDLAEGPRMMSRVVDVETAPIGTKLRAKIIEADGAPLVVFEVAQ